MGNGSQVPSGEGDAERSPLTERTESCVFGHRTPGKMKCALPVPTGCFPDRTGTRSPGRGPCPGSFLLPAAGDVLPETGGPAVTPQGAPARHRHPSFMVSTAFHPLTCKCRALAPSVSLIAGKSLFPAPRPITARSRGQCSRPSSRLWPLEGGANGIGGRRAKKTPDCALQGPLRRWGAPREWTESSTPGDTAGGSGHGGEVLGS